jgi:hypothetical protein
MIINIRLHVLKQYIYIYIYRYSNYSKTNLLILYTLTLLITPIIDTRMIKYAHFEYQQNS